MIGLKPNCIRCDKEFNQIPISEAHYFTICYDCRKLNPESLSDQLKYNTRKYSLFIGK